MYLPVLNICALGNQLFELLSTTMLICVFQYPVVAVDDWMAVTNPFTRTQHGHLRVLLALGSEEQVIGSSF